MRAYPPLLLIRWYSLILVATLLFRICLIVRRLDLHRQFLKLGNSAGNCRGIALVLIDFLGFW